MSGFRYHPEILEGIPAHQIEYLKQYEDWFIIEPEGLKRITEHFVTELEKGLTKEGGNIPMDVTWVMGYPSGHETGDVLTIDMGGTNLRVCQVCLSNRKREFEQIQRGLKFPDEVKTGTGEQLWDFIAGCLELFLAEYNIALINDTTGTLIASHYRDPQVKVGSIISTGVNAAYMEECKFIPKIAGDKLPANSKVIINAEYGSFDNDREVLPLTSFDQQIDRESARPGTQIYEKMVSGQYMGEMLRLILINLHEQGRLFKGLDATRLRHENSIETSFLSVTELDLSENLDDIREEFEESLSLSPELDNLKVCRYLIGLVATRAARLYACDIAAICKKKNIKKCHVGVDGSVFNKYSGFKGRAAQGLRNIFDWPPTELELIALNASEDASGVGAALAAALILEGEQKAKLL
ncbi:Hexokinase [Penicillium odoratum]|uniref:Hexokinase n=1 Tax=Penicillium odoratum TaxID=1167516 RepID=UPI0025469A86|nr:Hexokinase [Penicillium odoratum]KAJ5772679.1 Hexokinase [Penicillium odoratum]